MKSSEFSIIIVISLCYSSSAVAYIDPGTGSIILQMLIAGIIGAMYTIKLYWYRLKDFITQLFGFKKKPEVEFLDTENESEDKDQH